MGWIIGFAILWFVLRRSRRRMWTRRRAHMVRRTALHPGGRWQVHGGAWGWDHNAWGWHDGASGWGWHGGRSGWRGGALAGPPLAHAQYRGQQLPQFEHVMRRPGSAPSRESEFDALKRRYVAGDLSDEQYEAELDVLFSTAEGRRQV